MPDTPSVAVLGFRPHTYWTAVVALTGKIGAPEVIERRRITFAAGDTRSVYHRVEAMDAVHAEAWIAGVWAATETNARREIGALLNSLRAVGVSVHTAIVPIGRAKVPDKLEDILKSHSHMHAAEGDFYRGVVAQACSGLGLKVHRVVERVLPGQVCELLHVEPSLLETRMKDMGAVLGPPWSEDYKLATQAAWSRLEDENARPARRSAGAPD